MFRAPLGLWWASSKTTLETTSVYGKPSTPREWCDYFLNRNAFFIHVSIACSEDCSATSGVVSTQMPKRTN